MQANINKIQSIYVNIICLISIDYYWLLWFALERQAKIALMKAPIYLSWQVEQVQTNKLSLLSSYKINKGILWSEAKVTMEQWLSQPWQMKPSSFTCLTSPYKVSGLFISKAPLKKSTLLLLTKIFRR